MLPSLPLALLDIGSCHLMLQHLGRDGAAGRLPSRSTRREPVSHIWMTCRSSG
jgi:hypothetical protein